MARRLQRRGFAPLLGLALVLGLSQGCFSKLDPEKIPCDMNRKTSCPTGYVCTLVDGLGPMCRRPTDGGFDAPTIVTEAGAPDLAGEAQPTRVDGPLSEAGWGEAGAGSRLETGVDFGTGSPSDVPIGASETGGGDRPAGTGGSFGGDAVNYPGLDLGTDVPQIVPTDAATGGAGGAGGMIGTGGGGGTSGGAGTGGTGGTGGATGTGGGGGTGGGTGTGGSRTNGSPCTGTQDCDSGNCADYVCCDKPCGACSACTLALTSKPDGTCAPVLGGVDPHSACADETATNQCGNDGFCDGKGACRKVGTSHVCTAGVCNSTLFTPASTCDGLGACLPVSATDCGLSACSPTEGCQTTCSTDGQCVGQSYCDTTASTCKAKKTDGLDCTLGKECVSAFCIDGVCCHTDCGGCNACALALTGQASGTCAPATVDTDPHNTCSLDSPPCGHDGNCDGAGDCKFAPATTGCGAEACTGTLYTPAAYCTGTGTCDGVSSAACPNNLACGTTQCKTTCSTNTDCAAGFTCPSPGSSSCTTPPCDPGLHDGGNGTCVPVYTCVAGYHNGGSGKCVVNATCPTGQLTDDSGTCVPMAGSVWIQRGVLNSWEQVVSSADGTKLVARTHAYGALYTSIDSGVTWTAQTTLHGWGSLATSSDGTKLVAGADDTGILTSTDSGVSWTRRYGGSTYIYRVASSADGSKLVAANAVDAENSTYTSADSGAHWTSRATSYVRCVALASSADGVMVFAARIGSSSVTLYRSTDYGATWPTSGLKGFSNSTTLSLAVSSDGTKLIAASPTDINTSTDSGVSWTKRMSATFLRSVASSSDGTKLAAVDNGGYIYISNDSGVTWAQHGSVQKWSSIASSADGAKLVAVAGGMNDTGYIYTSTGPVP